MRGLWLSLLLSGAGHAAPGEDARRNVVSQPQPGPISARARAIHRGVVDLHADTLLWQRDLLERHGFGHVDLPRLEAGKVGLQVFSIVTHAPSRWRQPFYTRADDAVARLVRAQARPAETHTSVLARALDQASSLDRAVRRSKGRLRWVRSVSELDALPAETVGVLLSLEGAHALEARLGNVDRLADAGVRMIGLAHFIDNAVGGSAHGARRGGLTAFGRRVLARMAARGIAVDLAHAAPQLFADVIASARRPVFVSHTGVRATCDRPRNLTDAQLRAVARTGGVVGIGYWEHATCGRDLAAFARAVKHAIAVAGPEGVALGSDFDGSVTMPVHAGDLGHVTEALLGAGVPAQTVVRVLRTNAIRALRKTLPPGPSATSAP